VTTGSYCAGKTPTVIDPMLARVADLFARGKNGGDDQTWDIIRNNLESLATFVDTLILEAGIPIFDYKAMDVADE
jgi:hypothetical protein